MISSTRFFSCFALLVGTFACGSAVDQNPGDSAGAGTASGTAQGSGGAGGGPTDPCVDGCCGGGCPSFDCQSSQDCAADELCAFEPEGCAPSVYAYCEKRPSSCDGYEIEPSCGCDGQLYANSCEAARAGTNVSGGSECVGPDDEDVFACGPEICVKNTQACVRTGPPEGAPSNLAVTYRCDPLPVACGAQPACECYSEPPEVYLNPGVPYECSCATPVGAVQWSCDLTDY